MPTDPKRLNRRVKLRDLDTLLTVVHAGGMRKAAEQLHLSQPAISKAIAELEASLGVLLLDRSRRGTEVTAAGQALIRRAEVMFDELQQGLRDLEHLADPDAGSINLACSEPILGGLVTTAMQRMWRLHPRVNFNAESGATPDRQVQYLRDRISDFVIARPMGLALGPEIRSEPLFRERVDIVVGHASPFARRRKLTLADVANAPWIISPVEARSDSPVVVAFNAAGLPFPRCWLTGGSLNARFALLATGRFVTLMPHSFLHFAGMHHRIKVLPIALPQWTAPTSLLTLHNHSLSPAVQRFIDMVRELARPLGG